MNEYLGIAAICLCPLVGACATSSAMDIAPPNAMQIILANKSRLWKDPDSIKNASIAAPSRHLEFMWHVCVRMNAKNSFGGYVGEREQVVGIYDDGRPPAVLMEDDQFNCPRRSHAPFPQLNGRL